MLYFPATVFSKQVCVISSAKPILLSHYRACCNVLEAEGMSGSITNLINRAKLDSVEGKNSFAQRMRVFVLGVLSANNRGPFPRQIDVEGIADESITKFLNGLVEQRFPKLQNRDDARKLLTTIAKRIFVTEQRRLLRMKRTPAREVPSPAGRPEELADREPGPDQQAVLREQGEQWIRQFEAEIRSIHRTKAIEIVGLLVEGATVHDISQVVKLGPGSVRNIISRIVQKLGPADGGTNQSRDD